MKSFLSPSFAPSRPPRFLGGLALTAALALAATHVRADDTPGRVHGLFGLEFSDKYLTPRGMIVQDRGLTMQALTLALVNVYKGDGESFISDVTLTPGFWNDYATSPVAVHTSPGSSRTGWVEIDPIFGVSISFAKSFKLDVTYTEFGMQILDIGTSQHLETKLSYDDTKVMGAYALHPYISYWKELSGKATAAANFGVPDSSYIDVGIDPGFSSGEYKFEFPSRLLIPDKNFYGETFAGKSTVAIYEIGVKVSMPANFMPQGYGHWGAHIGYKYMNFADKNLQQLAKNGGFGGRTKDTGQIYAGLTSFF